MSPNRFYRVIQGSRFFICLLNLNLMNLNWNFLAQIIVNK